MELKMTAELCPNHSTFTGNFKTRCKQYLKTMQDISEILPAVKYSMF